MRATIKRYKQNVEYYIVMCRDKCAIKNSGDDVIIIKKKEPAKE